MGVVELGGDWGRGQTLIGCTLREYVNWAQYSHNTIYEYSSNVEEEQEKKGDHLTWLGVVEVETGAEAKP